MHSALLIRELVDTIFGFLVVRVYFCNEETRNVSNRTLASLALTCRAFHEPALNYLWHTQTSLRPIFLLFWDSITEVTTNSTDDKRTCSPMKRLVLEGTPTEADISRFLKYARKIYFLRRASPYPNSYSQIIDVTCLQFLAQYRSNCEQSTPLFPSIREIQWPVGGVDNSLVDYASLFIGPKLIDLDIEIAHTTSMPDTLAQLRSIPSPLQSFALQTHFCDPDPMSSVIDGILECSQRLINVQLEFLSLSGLLRQWKLLSTLPRLESLWFCLPGEIEPRKAESPKALSTTHPHFPALKEFTLFHQMMGPSLVDFLGGFLTQRLHHLEELCLIFESPQGCMDSVIPYIHRVCNPEELKTLKVLVWGHSNNERAGAQPDFLPHTISPLRSFPNLSTVVLQPMVHLDLDNNALKEMAKSWSKLEYLDIGRSDLWVSQPRTTLAGLIPFARDCRNLRGLSIVIDARVPIPEDALKEVENATWRSRMIEINVSYSPIENTTQNVDAVSSFLLKLFPHLRTVHCGGASLEGSGAGGRREIVRGWTGVQSAIRCRRYGAVSPTLKEDNKQTSVVEATPTSDTVSEYSP